jgi:hypothetical protein
MLMKTQQSLERSIRSSIKKAILLCGEIQAELLRMEVSHDTALHMPVVRKELAELNQRIHEYNAYQNTLTTR